MVGRYLVVAGGLVNPGGAALSSVDTIIFAGVLGAHDKEWGG